MGYLDLAQQARARQLASARGADRPADGVPPDEFNELTKKPPRPTHGNITATLRAAFRRCFTLVVAEADGERIDPRAAQAVHQEILRLTDDAGPLWADAVFADELRRFRWETARCGLCGGLGHPLEEPPA
jgi:hypothetical protein